MNALEYRSGALISAGKSRRIGGRGVAYDAPSKPLFERGRHFVEIIRPGALRAAADTLLLFGHDSNRPLARTTGGSLKLRDTSAGLEFEAMLPETRDADDTLELIRAGVLRGTSFGFVVEADQWSDGDGKMPVRTVTAGSLHELSIVATPAYGQTTVENRSYTGEHPAMQRLRLRAAQRRQRQIALLRFGG